MPNKPASLYDTKMAMHTNTTGHAVERIDTPQARNDVGPVAGGGGLGELPPGSYWQVIAVNPGGVEAMRQTLKDKGFQVALTPGRSNLTRVLVGPYNDTPSLGRAKTELEALKFQPLRYKRD